MTLNNIRFIMLMDLHFGAISTDRMNEEIDKVLFNKLKEHSKDCKSTIAIIGGDLFDSKQYLTSEVTQSVISFLNKLSLLVDYIIVMTGTKTHDDMQLDTLKLVYQDQISIIDTEEHSAKFIFINKVARLRIHYEYDFYIEVKDISDEDEDIDTINMLMIPEEYMSDQEEYYKPYFEDKYYQMIIGHGMIDKVWYAKQNKEKMEATKQTYAPVFNVDDLLNHCDVTYWGHVHIHKRYGDNGRFLYVGPFTRWEFGKDGDVGFEIVNYNIPEKSFTDSFIVNEYAQVMMTKVLNINETITLTDLNIKLDKIISKVMQESDKLRFVINIDSSIENYQSIKDFTISKLSDMKNIKLVLSLNMSQTIMEQTEAMLDSDSIEKQYIFEPMPIEARIKRFLKDKRGIDISEDKIKMILEESDGK